MIVNFRTGDGLVLKKKHPCGGNHFDVLFAGSDVKVRCKTCGREMILSRLKLEKNIKSVICGEEND